MIRSLFEDNGINTLVKSDEALGKAAKWIGTPFNFLKH